MNEQLNYRFEEFCNALKKVIITCQDQAAAESILLDPNIGNDLEENKDTSYSEHGLIIGINGRWGVGKTTFLNYFLKKINTKDFLAIQYNAWSYDYIEEPLYSLIDQIGKQIQSKQINSENEINGSNQIQKKNSLKSSFSNALIRLIKAVEVEQAFGNKNLIGMETKIKIVGEKFFSPEKAISLEGKNSILDDYLDLKKALDEFIEAFKNLGSCNTVKILIIDELDRCIPIFAVKLLERLKHFFLIKNLCVIIACDKDNLVESIRKVYGNIDAEQYLSRFFNIEYELPEPLDSGFISFDGILSHNKVNLARNMFESYKIPVRERLKIKNYLKILQSSVQDIEIELIFLITLKLFSLRKFQKIYKQDFSCIADEKEISGLLKTFIKDISPDEKNLECEFNTRSKEDFDQLIYSVFFLFIGRDNNDQSTYEIIRMIHDNKTLPATVKSVTEKYLVNRNNSLHLFSKENARQILNSIAYLK